LLPFAQHVDLSVICKRREKHSIQNNNGDDDEDIFFCTS
jgi:hypothetical protein